MVHMYIRPCRISTINRNPPALSLKLHALLQARQDASSPGRRRGGAREGACTVGAIRTMMGVRTRITIIPIQIVAVANCENNTYDSITSNGVRYPFESFQTLGGPSKVFLYEGSCYLGCILGAPDSWRLPYSMVPDS